ncbi:DEAD/DEAH box helicase [Vibrio viridaestus]|uniref:DEAD/DEAH box helicase n=2 Tax=Vibrio viridaestus TaxID=2487322 RepID=A0A3N9TLF2_9VIBR|nr:DEAD/DEAH box helicase [Vibrio viridaestus]RQW65179.1 DEAD/DEAH box helicase [Vibrio viridaestus]
MLGLSSELCACIQSLSFDEPTDIQYEAIPKILEGNDLIAGAQTGSGKTLAYLLPIIEKLMTVKSLDTIYGSPKALIITPTRELAQQVYTAFEPFGEALGLSGACFYGGASINEQKKKLRSNIDVVIGTTGRLLDLIHIRSLNVTNVQLWVLDEGDRMLDMGFTPDIQRLKKKFSVKPQTLLFSATYNPQVLKFSQTLLSQPSRVQVDLENSTVESIEQRLYELNQSQKMKALSFLIGSENWQQVLVFVKMKGMTETLAKELKLDGISAATIHGDKSQGAREKALADFSTGRTRVLVATDVAARGIHIDDLQVVVNFDMPFKAEDYVHRVGRTGRQNKAGLAVSFVTTKENSMLRDIEQLVEQRFTLQWLAGFEPKEEIVVDESPNAPKRKGRNHEKQMLKKRLKIHASRGKK